MERIAILLLLVAYAQGHSCRACDKSTCIRPTNCPGGVAYDACRCCQICARQESQTCGGWYGMSGTCDVGLKCVTPVSPGRLPSGQEIGTCKPIDWESESDTCREMNFVGCDVIDERCKCSTIRACANPFRFPDERICQQHLLTIAKSRQNCSNHRCEVRYIPNCPPDSEVERSRWPAGECCPLPAKCRCRNACKPRVCPRNYDRVLVKPATGVPGSCCNYYKCKPKKYDCSDVVCPTYDQNITCPADSIEITDRRAKDGCCMLPPRCKCKSIVCTHTSCPAGEWPLVLVQGDGKSGRCCDEIRCVKMKPKGSCQYEGKIYQHRESFPMEPCITCRCLDGEYHCSRENCPILGCKNQYTPEGRCCPKCRIIIQTPPPSTRPLLPKLQRVCTDYVGEVHFQGSVWFPDDCTRCVCNEDGPLCTASACQRECEFPRKVKGVCCGVCDEPTYISIPATCPSTAHCNLTGAECPFGFKSDVIGCRICECREKSEVCGDISRCKRRCPNGYVINELGCETCRCKRKECGSCAKRCPFGYRSEKGRCSKCKCRKCADIIGSCDKKCKYGKVVNKYGCKICKCRSVGTKRLSTSSRSVSCVDEKSRRDDGEEWNTASGRVCVCRRGDILCDMLECPVPDCERPVVLKGSPCAICPDSPQVYVQGLECMGRVDGEAWEADSCTSCVCVSGRVMCSFEVCAAVPCVKPVFKEDHCCPTCPDLPNVTQTNARCVDIDGTSRPSGATWRRDKCTSCKCEAGVVRCFGETCPQEHNCPNPVVKRDQCCPQCLDDPDMNSCQVGDRNFTHGEIWSTSSDNCEFCSCVHGNTLCRRELCRPLPDDCNRVVKRRGECCSVCDTTKIFSTSTFAVSPTSHTMTTSTTTTTVKTSSSGRSSDPVEVGKASAGMMPILAGVGGAIILLILVAVVAFYGFKKRKIAAKSAIYKAGSIKKSVKA